MAESRQHASGVADDCGQCSGAPGESWVAYRSDYPESAEDQRVHNVYVQRDGEHMRLWPEPVTFTRLQPLNHTTSACEQVYLAHEGE